jgi:MSHA biogenesis protein MshL
MSMRTPTLSCRSALLAMLAAALLGSCGGATNSRPLEEKMQSTLDAAARNRAPSAAQQSRQDAAIRDALLPPLQPSPPPGVTRKLEPRFDLMVSQAVASQVLMSLVTDTRYTMLVHPDISGLISVHLKDVTLFEALDALRDLYNFEYKVDGNRILVQPRTLQTRVFKINYIAGRRQGSSDLRVTSGSVSTAPNYGGSSNTSGTSNTGGQTPTPQPIGGAANQRSNDTSRLSTQTDSDFWKELNLTLQAIVGNEDGRNIIVTPQAGIIVARAMPQELRTVEAYLEAMQLAVTRQVILEAKILEVQLSDSYQTGINWGIFNLARNGSTNLASGMSLPINGISGTGATGTLGAPSVNSTSGSTVSGGTVPTYADLGKGVFSLALTGTNFAAILDMLQGQGKVNVLSSPRIATLNNQKAVLKVGNDDFYVTNISVTQTTGTTTTNTPSVTLQPFFSGIALDVTPQIDEDDNVMLHVHPSVSTVTEKNKIINAGLGSPLQLPLASSTISETDSVIRARDGQIVVIGGLMSYASNNERNGIPGTGDIPLVSTLFGNTRQSMSKRELVILLKPTVISSDSDWAQDISASGERTRRLRSADGRDSANDGKR